MPSLGLTKIMKSVSMKITGAIVVIINDENKTLLLKRPNWIKWAPGKWAFPGGKIEKGETTLAAAIRETYEETQLAVGNLKEVKVLPDRPVAVYYTYEYEGEVEIDFEHDDWAWVSMAEAPAYELAPDVLETYDWVLKNGT